MRAAWYERQGPAHQVLETGHMADPEPAANELRVRLACSGLHPGDVKKRSDEFGVGMSYPRVVPHSDGAGWVDAVGGAIDPAWVGKRVWCFGAQSYRPYGTAAEFVVLPQTHVSELPGDVPWEEAASLGIPGITAHRAVDVAGPIEGKVVLVHGAAGSVGRCAVHLAHRRGARVLATVRTVEQQEVALHAGADHVLFPGQTLEADIRALAPQGVDHVVEVAFGANIGLDVASLRDSGSIAAYATDAATPGVPFWPLVFKNVRIHFLGSDDFPAEAKARASRELSAALAEGWRPFHVFDRYPLTDIATAHEQVEQGQPHGKVVIAVTEVAGESR